MDTCEAVKMTTWRAIDEATYYDRLGQIYPSYRTGHGFQCGEPANHLRCTVNGGIHPAYASFVAVRRDASTVDFFESVTPLTNAEFEQITPAIVKAKRIGPLFMVSWYNSTTDTAGQYLAYTRADAEAHKAACEKQGSDVEVTMEATP
jgi:hypothetical protein